MEKLGKVIGIIGRIVAGVGAGYLIGVMGTSDVEVYTHEFHTFGWLIKSVFLVLVIVISGFCLIKLSDKLIILSGKKFVRVWIRNTTNNKIKARLVEKDGYITLSEDEEIHRIGRKVYCFQ